MDLCGRRNRFLLGPLSPPWFLDRSGETEPSRALSKQSCVMFAAMHAVPLATRTEDAIDDSDRFVSSPLYCDKFLGCGGRRVCVEQAADLIKESLVGLHGTTTPITLLVPHCVLAYLSAAGEGRC